MIVFNGQLIYVVSNKPLKKITSDFKKLEYLSISVDTCIQQKMYNMLYDIQLTANHICTLFKKDLGTNVVCTNNDLHEITFKDIDVI